MQYIEIRIKGQIDVDWSAWFEGLKIIHSGLHETVLIGSIPDQAALYGLMAKLRDLGLLVRSVNYGEQKLDREE